MKFRNAALLVVMGPRGTSRVAGFFFLLAALVVASWVAFR